MNEQVVTFLDCILYCAGIPELVEQFNRLTGCQLGQSLNRSQLEKLIDDTAGYSGERDEDMAAFVEFVYDCVWLRLPPDAKVVEAVAVS